MEVWVHILNSVLFKEQIANLNQELNSHLCLSGVARKMLYNPDPSTRTA